MTRKSFILGTWIVALVLVGAFYVAYRIFMNNVPEAYRTGTSIQPEHTATRATSSFKELSVLSQPVVTNAYPKGYPLEITQADNDAFDREKATAIKALANDLRSYVQENKRFPTEDEFKNLIDKKYSGTLGGEYYQQNLQYYDYTGDSGPPHFLLFYVLTQLRDYAFGHGSPGGCGFAGCIGYHVDQTDLATGNNP